ncbi:2'-5' RNA ligase family protein [Roseimicrobium sp. ORNL1]|uniref:2'-5' RNA ligase family protein n=1 Tax=Roseimicrobium sp. ORNL1 TaxID=2711231 RepID=UPI00198067E9|nr:2'-5' RNA ligase family protein [Roseimicrobium sp. ORNL1]
MTGAEPQPSTRSLFLALFPGHATIQHICEQMPGIRQQHGLTSKMRPLEHLHLTLHWIGDYPEVPEDLVQIIGHACKQVANRVSPFEVKLDEVLSFRGRPGRNPLVLSGTDADNAKLTSLHQTLLLELAKVLPLKKGGLKFHPHLTLLYDKQGNIKAPANPVTWTADEIVLVCSEVGHTKYHRLGAWKLQA